MKLKVIEPKERFHTKIDWLESFHIFNFSENYRDGRNGFGDLLVVNDDYVEPRTGFGMHPHRDMEIVTWVLSGSLSHEDNGGNKGTITPGEIQQMSAGTGVLHSEMNLSDEQVHLVQMWVLPDVKGVQPRYQQQNVEHLIKNQLGCVASGKIDAPIHLHNKNASLYVGRYDSKSNVELPISEKLYIYVARGNVNFDNTIFEEGNSLLIESNNKTASLEAGENTEIIVWAVGSDAREQARLPD